MEHRLLGREADFIRELAEAAQGCTVYADCDLDAYWLETLCAGVGTTLPFVILYLGELLESMHVPRPVVVAALGGVDTYLSHSMMAASVTMAR